MEDDNHMSHMQTLVTVVSLLLLLSSLPQSQCQPPHSIPNYYSVCRDESYNCGTTLTNISYPFWGQQRPSACGADNLFQLNCSYDNKNTTTIQIGAQEFTVKEINTTAYTITMVRTEVDACSPYFNEDNTLLRDPMLFRYPDPQSVLYINIFYDCPSIDPYDGNNFTCGNDKKKGTYRLGVVDEIPWPQSCGKHVQVPTKFPYNVTPGFDGLKNALGKEFEMHYFFSPRCITCSGKEGGVCGTNDTADDPLHHEFTCYHQLSSPSHLNWKRKIIIGVVSAAFGAIAVFAVFYYLRRQKKNSYAKSYIQSQSFSTAPSFQDTEKGSRYFGVPLFTYTELEEATNYFDSSRELGEGGFGTVYFGKLQDGRNVAVKRLYENNYRRIEQFMNEVEILTRLVHPNLVTLYGCTSRHSRELLLVYEYIANGTVADHLHGNKAKPGKLPWHIRMNIAVETASALKYLHISEIIHRDVKTNNILLDNHFRVKVADFGLSRLFPNAVTHISTAPQGTPGYVDPEYHECYQLTNKSDVYSFGVVLVELISSLPAVDITRHRHEINLANMAINKIHNQALHELVDPSLGFDSDPKVRKMINAVAELAFQCLQSSKDLRPSMDEVVDTLKDIQSDGKYKSQPEVLDISASAGDDVVLLKDDPPPLSPDSNAVSMSTTPNTSG